MDRKEAAALDRYITGNYGEDQTKDEQEQYTPGALRAGKGISARFRKALPRLPDTNAETLAAIITKETGDAEMLRILEAIDRFWGDGVCPAPVWPGAYLADEDVAISDLVHLAVNRAKGIVRP